MTSSKKPSQEQGSAPVTAPPLSATHEREIAQKISSGAPQRLSAVIFGDEDVSAEIARAPELPAPWLDRLLDVSVQLPVKEGESEVVGVVLDVVAELLTPAAVGVCFVDSRDQQKILRRGVRTEQSVDPTRLFPGYAHEVILELPELAGSTLHAASDDSALLAATGPAARLLARAANVIRSGLSHARLHRGAQMSHGEVQSLTSQMVQAEKLAQLGQIAAGMVHELNNPLTSIVAYTDYLIRKFMAQSSAGLAIAHDDLERLKKIGDSANRMLRFTRDLVSYARPSGEALVPVVLRSTIEQAIAFCEHVIAESGTTIERRYGEDVLSVRARHEQLTQVFVNLVTNACHAVPREGGRIAITTDLAPDGRMVRVTMEDNGHGIEPENLSRVFAPFFTTKRDGRGTGLGLSIVKNIVEGHDGSISVTSEPRVGTRFVIRLPAFRRDD